MKVHPLNDLGTQRNTSSSQNTVAEVFVTFLKLGLTSFGEPIAHLIYFRRELVEQRRWVLATMGRGEPSLYLVGQS